MKIIRKARKWISSHLYSDIILAIPLIIFPMTTVTFFILPKIESIVEKLIS